MVHQPWLLKPEEEDQTRSRTLDLVNLDDLFYRTPGAKVINSENTLEKEYTDKVIKNIYSNCDGELGFVPTCECGYTRGVSKEHLICPMCHTECSTKFADGLEHTAWVGIPEPNPEMGKPGFAPVLHPIWYLMLKNFTKIGNSSKESLIDYILNPLLGSGSKTRSLIPDDFPAYIPGRGWDYFYEHADEILDILMYKYPRTADKQDQIQQLAAFRQKYRSMLFTRHLPIMHNALHPITNNGNTLNYVDSASNFITEAVFNLTAETFKLKLSAHKSNNRKNKVLWDVYQLIIGYYKSLENDKLFKKPGLLRKQIFGGRLHWTFRTVVHAQSEPEPLDEIIMPWGIMLNSLKLPIINLLVNRKKLTPSDALHLWVKGATTYQPLIEEVLHEYISEAPGGRIPVLMGRNPTLTYGSELLLYVRKFKTKIDDETIGVNACIVEPLNMDFDGDEAYGLFIFEHALEKALQQIHPSSLMFNINGPGFSSRIGMIKQGWTMLTAYTEEDPDINHYEEIS